MVKKPLVGVGINGDNRQNNGENIPLKCFPEAKTQWRISPHSGSQKAQREVELTEIQASQPQRPEEKTQVQRLDDQYRPVQRILPYPTCEKFAKIHSIQGRKPSLHFQENAIWAQHRAPNFSKGNFLYCQGKSNTVPQNSNHRLSRRFPDLRRIKGGGGKSHPKPVETPEESKFCCQQGKIRNHSEKIPRVSGHSHWKQLQDDRKEAEKNNRENTIDPQIREIHSEKNLSNSRHYCQQLPHSPDTETAGETILPLGSRPTTWTSSQEKCQRMAKIGKSTKQTQRTFTNSPQNNSGESTPGRLLEIRAGDIRHHRRLKHRLRLLDTRVEYQTTNAVENVGNSPPNCSQGTHRGEGMLQSNRRKMRKQAHSSFDGLPERPGQFGKSLHEETNGFHIRNIPQSPIAKPATKNPMDSNRAEHHSRPTVSLQKKSNLGKPVPQIWRRTRIRRLQPLMGLHPNFKVDKQFRQKRQCQNDGQFDKLFVLEGCGGTGNYSRKIKFAIKEINHQGGKPTTSFNLSEHLKRLLEDKHLHLRCSTKNQYLSKLKIFIAWAHAHQKRFDRINSTDVKEYLLFRVAQGQAKSAKSDLNAINWGRETLDLEKIPNTPVLKNTIKYCQLMAKTETTKRAKPLEFEIVQKMMARTIRRHPPERIFNLKCLLGFTLGLRHSEITHIKKSSFKKPKNGLVEIDLGLTKTNRREVVYLETKNENWPLYQELQRYWAEHPLDFEPFKGQTANQFTTQLRRELRNRYGIEDTEDYSSHSLRRGGANFLFLKGATEAEIMKWGRWTSNTFLRYLEQANAPTLGKYI